MSLANQIIRPADLFGRPAKPRKRRFTGRVHQDKLALARMKPVAIPGGVEITVPIRIFNESNLRGHWGGARTRAKKVRDAVHVAMVKCHGLLPAFPCRVELIRHGPRTMDFDGNVRAFKAVRDEIARYARLDDAESVGWQWVYAPQVKGEYAVTVRFTHE